MKAARLGASPKPAFREDEDDQAPMVPMISGARGG